jgi:probable HAF family extracellular repeat protein
MGQSTWHRTRLHWRALTAATMLVALAAVAAVDARPAVAGTGSTDATRAGWADRPYQAMDLGFAATAASLSINDRGQVVGGNHLWQDGRLTSLGAPVGFNRFEAREINETGMVVGVSTAPDWVTRATVWHRGAFTTIELPGGMASYAISVNDLGTVFGGGDTTSPDQGFLWHRGKLTMLWHNNPYAAQTGINNWGDVVGEYEPTPGYPCDCRGYRWHRGVLTDLGDLGGEGLWPNQPADVNNRREIVGGALTTTEDRHAYLWRGGVIRDLGTLGGPTSSAVAISDRGEVIGHADTATGTRHPFRWQHGTMTDLTTLGLRPTDQVVDINSQGHILGLRDGRATLFVPAAGAAPW